MRIVLIRHGRPKIDLDTIRFKRMSSVQMGDVIKNYKVSDLSEKQKIPLKTQQLVQNTNTIFASNIVRAISSAKLLTKQEVAVDAVFAESDHPYYNWQKPKLYFFTWAVAYRIMWFFGFKANGEAIKLGRKRAKLAAKKLEAAAITHQQTILFGHGIINRLIASALKKRGWRQVENSGHTYWSYIILEKI